MTADPHPAGLPPASAGEETDQRVSRLLQEAIDADMGPGSETVVLTGPRLQELAAIAAGRAPRSGHEEKRRVVLRSMGLAWRELYHPWTWHLTQAGRDSLPADTDEIAEGQGE